MKPTIKEFYDNIEIGKSYDFWTFTGFGNLLTINEDDRNADRKKMEAENKGWVWVLYKDDPMAGMVHRRLIITEKGLAVTPISNVL